MKLEDMVRGLMVTDTNCSKSSNCSSSKVAEPLNANIFKSSNCSNCSKADTSNIHTKRDKNINSLSFATATPATLATLDSPLPFIGKDGSLIIPFDSDPRFHWWAGGQSARETEREVKRWVH